MNIEIGDKVRVKEDIRKNRTFTVLQIHGSWAWVKWDGDDSTDSGILVITSNLRKRQVEIGEKVRYRNATEDTVGYLGTVEAMHCGEAWVRLYPGRQPNAKHRHITCMVEILEVV